jgi:hypothetical protein
MIKKSTRVPIQQACTTYGPRAKCGPLKLKSGPQRPNLRIFGLTFDGNTKTIRKNLTNLARKYFSTIFLASHEI